MQPGQPCVHTTRATLVSSEASQLLTGYAAQRAHAIIDDFIIAELDAPIRDHCQSCYGVLGVAHGFVR